MDTKLIVKLRKITQAGIIDCKRALDETKNDIDKAIVWLQKNGKAKALKKISNETYEGIIWASCNENVATIIEVNCQTDFIVKNDAFFSLIKEITSLIIKFLPKNLVELLKIKTIKNITIKDSILELSGILNEKLDIRRFLLITKKKSEAFGIYNHNNLQISSVIILQNNDVELAKNIAMQVASMAPKYISINDIDESKKNEVKEIVIANSQEKINNKPEKIQNMIINGSIHKKLSELTLYNQKYIINNGITIQKLMTEKNNIIINFFRYKIAEPLE